MYWGFWGIWLRTMGSSPISADAKKITVDTAELLQGSYRIPTLRQNNAPDFSVIHFPVHPQKKQVAGLNGGHNTAIFKDVSVERRRAAALVTRWMNEPHAQAQICIHATSLPVSKAAQSSRELTDTLLKDPQRKGFLDLAPHGWCWATLPCYPKIAASPNGNVAKILKQEVGVKDGLVTAQREAQLLLEEDVKLMK